MSGDLTLAVQRDVLRSVAGRLRAGLAGLDAALTRVQAAGPGVSSLAGWPTGDAFSGNVTSVYQAGLAAAGQVAEGHRADSAATYDAAESDSTSAVHRVAGS